MKSILLSSAAVIGLAGAASAEISWSASAVLGYNDTDLAGTAPAADTNADEAGTWSDNQFGFYWELDVDVTLSQTLDNGLTAGASFGFEVADENLGQDLTGSDYVLFLESDTAGLFFGDTDMAAGKHWTAAGDMEADDFSATDGETVLRGDVSFGGVDASVSYIVDGSELEQLSIGAVGTFGNFTVGMAYQEAVTDATAQVGADTAPANFNSDNYTFASGTLSGGDFDPDEVFGLFASTSFGGADVTLAYAKNNTEDEDSLGVSIAYPFGPVTATFYYVSESDAAGDNLGLNVAYEDGPISVALDLQDDQGTTKWALEGSYDVGNGLVVYAGVLNDNEADEDYYVAGELDLGSGASLLVSYADDADDNLEDEIGAMDYQKGTTVEVSFEF